MVVTARGPVRTLQDMGSLVTTGPLEVKMMDNPVSVYPLEFRCVRVILVSSFLELGLGRDTGVSP